MTGLSNGGAASWQFLREGSGIRLRIDSEGNSIGDCKVTNQAVKREIINHQAVIHISKSWDCSNSGSAKRTAGTSEVITVVETKQKKPQLSWKTSVESDTDFYWTADISTQLGFQDRWKSKRAWV